MPESTTVDGIRVTTAAWTIVDLAAHLSLEQLIKASNEADRLGIIDPDDFAFLVESLPGRRGIRKLRILLGGLNTSRTDSNLERRFLRIVSHLSLPRPQTQVYLHGYRVDFYWPDLNLVVETDGLTYHRTPAQQAADRKRDQVLTAAGLTCLRFTNEQIREDVRFVRDVLSRVVEERLPRR